MRVTETVLLTLGVLEYVGDIVTGADTVAVAVAV